MSVSINLHVTIRGNQEFGAPGYPHFLKINSADAFSAPFEGLTFLTNTFFTKALGALDVFPIYER